MVLGPGVLRNSADDTVLERKNARALPDLAKEKCEIGGEKFDFRGIFLHYKASATTHDGNYVVSLL